MSSTPNNTYRSPYSARTPAQDLGNTRQSQVAASNLLFAEVSLTSPERRGKRLQGNAVHVQGQWEQELERMDMEKSVFSIPTVRQSDLDEGSSLPIARGGGTMQEPASFPAVGLNFKKTLGELVAAETSTSGGKFRDPISFSVSPRSSSRSSTFSPLPTTQAQEQKKRRSEREHLDLNFTQQEQIRSANAFLRSQGKPPYDANQEIRRFLRDMNRAEIRGFVKFLKTAKKSNAIHDKDHKEEQDAIPRTRKENKTSAVHSLPKRKAHENELETEGHHVKRARKGGKSVDEDNYESRMASTPRQLTANSPASSNTITRAERNQKIQAAIPPEHDPPKSKRTLVAHPFSRIRAENPKNDSPQPQSQQQPTPKVERSRIHSRPLQMFDEGFLFHEEWALKPTDIDINGIPIIMEDSPPNGESDENDPYHTLLRDSIEKSMREFEAYGSSRKEYYLADRR